MLRNEELAPKDGCGIYLKRPLTAAGRRCWRLRDAAQVEHQGSGLAAALWRELREKLSLAVAVSLEHAGRLRLERGMECYIC